MRISLFLVTGITTALTALGISGCATIAVASAPDKVAVPDQSAPAQHAESAFWTAFHGGHYEDIGPVLDELEGVYLAHPEDPRIAAHVGFLHVWRVGERARLDHPPPTITDDLELARRYFEEAVKLSPKESRYRGFLAGMTMAEGSIHHDEKLTRTGFFAMNDAVNAWPEFNLFTRGYTMSQLPHDSERYANAVDDQWQTLDLCANGEHIDRKTADFTPYMHLETHEGWKRACWSSWVTPHNFEGFFLNMGDMIVKAGDPATARNVYAQAKLAREYPSWPYREVLERRITQADENVAAFRAPANGEKERRIVFETPFACTGCHQN